MADEIISKYSNLKITAEEDDVVVNDDIPHETSVLDLQLSTVGRVMTVRTFSFEAFKKTMNQIWAISKPALFRPIEHGLFVVQFASTRDKTKVMDGCPWTFDQHLVMMKDIESGFPPSEIELIYCPFWIRIYNLPLDSRSKKHVAAIGGSIGEVLEVESNDISWDKSARVKILLNVTKPLRRVQKVQNSMGKVVMVEIKYERLPTFCYGCGLIGHMERDCTVVGEEERDEAKQWGSWLKASPRKGRLKMDEEVKLFLSCSKKLAFSSVVVQEESVDHIDAREEALVKNKEGDNGVNETFSTCMMDNSRGSPTLCGEVSTSPTGDVARLLAASQQVLTTPSQHAGGTMPQHVAVKVSTPDDLSFSIGHNVSTKSGKKSKTGKKKLEIDKRKMSPMVLSPNHISSVNNGERRKLLEDMIINDDVKTVVVGVKRNKHANCEDPENSYKVAEVGATQPREQQ